MSTPFVDLALKTNKGAIEHLVNEFNIKRSARQRKNTRVRKTGIIDPQKLHSYRTNDEIFLGKKVSHDGTSHGFFVLLDWSASMKMRDLHIKMLEQVLVFSSFCERVKVPYEIITFTATKNFRKSGDKTIVTESSKNYEVIPVHLDQMDMVRILSSDFSASQKAHARNMINDILEASYRNFFLEHNGCYTDAMKNMIFNMAPTLFQQALENSVEPKYFSDRPKYDYYWNNKGFEKIPEIPINVRLADNKLNHMSGTPTLEALLVTEKLMGSFKKKNGIDNVNLLLITDGSCGDLHLGSVKDGFDCYGDPSVEEEIVGFLPAYQMSGLKQIKSVSLTGRFKYSETIRGISQRDRFSVEIGGILKEFNTEEQLTKAYELYNSSDLPMVPADQSGMGAILSVMKEKYGARTAIFYLFPETDGNQVHRGLTQFIASGYIGYLSRHYNFSRNGKAALSGFINERLTDHKGRIMIKGLHGADKFIAIEDVSGRSDKTLDEKEVLSNVGEGRKVKKLSAAVIAEGVKSSSIKKENSRFLAKELMEIFG